MFLKYLVAVPFSPQCSEYIMFFCLDYCYPFLGCCFFLETTGFSLDLPSIPFGSLPWSTLGWINLPCIYKAFMHVSIILLLIFICCYYICIFFFEFPSLFFFLLLDCTGFPSLWAFFSCSEQGYSFCSVWASHCCGFSCGAQAPGTQAFSGCGTQA